MKSTLPSLGTALALFLTGCTALTSENLSGYYANQPDGQARLRVTSGLTGYSLAAFDGTKWSEPVKMKPASPNDPPLNSTPALRDITAAAYGVDGFTLLKFKPDAQLAGVTLPYQYYFWPSGPAYRVTPQAGQ